MIEHCKYHSCITHVSGQTTGLNHPGAHFNFDWGLYPNNGFHPDSGLSQVGTDSCLILTVVYILTVVSSSLSDGSQQHSAHFYFNAYVNMLGRNDLITVLIN